MMCAEFLLGTYLQYKRADIASRLTSARSVASSEVKPVCSPSSGKAVAGPASTLLSRRGPVPPGAELPSAGFAYLSCINLINTTLC